MKDKDEIVELFSDKLRDMEADVNPQLWSKISTQLGAKAAAASTVQGGISLTAKIIGAVVGIAAISTVVLLVVNNSSVDEKGNISSNEITDSVKNQVTLKEGIKDEIRKSEELEKLNEKEVYEQDIVQENIKELPLELPVETELNIEHADEFLNKDRLVQEDTPGAEPINESPEVEDEQPNITEPLVENEPEEVDIEEQELNNPAPKESKIHIEVPNVFTPNGDGDNDFLFIKTDGELNDFAVVIFNARGEVVYRNADADFKWNGTDLSGGEVPDGVYLLMITAKDNEDKEVLKTAYVDLLR